jgi:hypothetical protein
MAIAPWSGSTIGSSQDSCDNQAIIIHYEPTMTSPLSFAPISTEAFTQGLTTALLAHASSEEGQTVEETLQDLRDAQWGPKDIEGTALMAACITRCLGYGAPNPTMENDFKQVVFDFENVLATKEDGPHIEGFTGLHEHPSGMVFYGAQAGGDWEHPVAFILYFDGEQYRAYIPRQGNTFNSKSMTAWGSEDQSPLGEDYEFEEWDGEDLPEGQMANAAKMIADIESAFGLNQPAADLVTTPAKTGGGKAGGGKTSKAITTEDCKAFLDQDATVAQANIRGPWKRTRKAKVDQQVVRHFSGVGGFVAVAERDDGNLEVISTGTSETELLLAASRKTARRPGP